MSDVPPPVPSMDAKSAVKWPAICLRVTAAVGIALHIVGFIVNASGIDFTAAFFRRGADIETFLGRRGMALNVLAIIVGAFIIFGATKMERLRNYSQAVTAALVAMIPCVSPCCLFGLPFGLWAMVVLLHPDVQDAFDTGGSGSPTV